MMTSRPKDRGDFWAWVYSSKPGDEAEYFIGDIAVFRAMARRDRLNQADQKRLFLAEAAWRAEKEKRVNLVQRRLMEGVFVYVAQKRSGK